MNNAESVRKFQAGVALWQPRENSFLEGAILKELRRRSVKSKTPPFQGCEQISSGIFKPRVSKQTLG